MDLRGWNDRYRGKAHRFEDLEAPPTPLLVETAGKLRPGKALDLAAGTGRNALWLARRGWVVQAVDGASAAIEILNERAAVEELAIETAIADLTSSGWRGVADEFDLVAICYYLQRSLFATAGACVKPGGLLLTIVHITQCDEEPTESRLRRGELAGYFEGWEILHHREGKSADPAHKRDVAEMVARRPI